MKLHSLQALRAAAAMLVVIDHAILFLVWNGALPRAPYEHLAWFLGGLGVYVFFVISGFIMMHASGDAFGTGATGRFLLRRAVRIVPLYWAGTTLIIMLRILEGNAPSFHEVATSLAFITTPNEEGRSMRPLLGQGWTLTYEAMFYVVFSVGLVFRRRLGLPLIVGGLIAVIGLGTLHKPLSDTSGATGWAAFYTDPILILFAVGIGVHTLSRRLPPLGSGAALSLAAVTMAAAVLLFVSAIQAYPVSLSWTLIIFALATLCVLFATLDRDSACGRFGAALGRLGDASYAVYIFHSFVIMVAGRVLMKIGLLNPWIFVPLIIVASGVLGHLIHIYFEKPVMKVLNGWIERWAAARRAGTTPTGAAVWTGAARS